MTGLLSNQAVKKLATINNCHPITLCADLETRRILEDLLKREIYTISPEARAAINAALVESIEIASPIIPTTDFETVAYADQEEALVCKSDVDTGNYRFTAGASYRLTTGTYNFTERFNRNKVHFDEQTMTTYTREHECILSGQDRFIQVSDDGGRKIKFMDRPKNEATEFEEKILWTLFNKPDVRTVAETCSEHVELNLAVLRTCEMMAGYTYYAGQMGYLSRVGVKDHALVAAETGTGKTLCAISLIVMKTPARTLIIAPQATVKSRKDEDDDDSEEATDEPEMTAPQWVKELNRFAPYLQVWEIFSQQDYDRVCSLNNGELPPGVYITYPEAFLANGSMESAPKSWDDEKLNKWSKAHGFSELEKWEAGEDDEGEEKRHWCNTIGKEENGIRCIVEPCLATKIGHLFDCIIVDEAHLAVNLSSNRTQMLIRLQPKFRFALTATPIPNVITNLFSLMGWLAVPDWYKGDRRNAAWPYAREDVGKFDATFRSQERDLTQEAENKRNDPRWTGKCVKQSPIISSPARLLKLIKPTMAFISKAACNPNYIPPKIIDVRVPLGREQAKLYGHFLNRSNIPAKHPLIRARKQSAYLRGICTDPAGFRHGGPKVGSNMNPKVIATLELVKEILGRGESVVIINSRVGITDTIQNKLTEAGVPIARIDSSIDADQQAAQAALFKSGKAPVMLMGIKCASAHSFDDCPNLIISSLEFSPGPYRQAIGRIDRVTNKVQKKIYVILNRCTIDEIMWETVATKDDASVICLRGQRVPREFRPVDASEILANAIDKFDLSGATPETQCEAKWPKLCTAIRNAVNSRN